ncbi:MAG: HEPN domain-containing protein [Candidatus Bathyarchaeia archaeon]
MVSSVDEVEVLLARSKKFINLASTCVEQEIHDLACFHAQQSTQLLVKAFTLKRIGYIPRTHSIREIMGVLAKQLNVQQLSEYVKTHRLELMALEDAYVSSRYFVKEFTRDDAEECIRIAREVTELVQRTIRDP